MENQIINNYNTEEIKDRIKYLKLDISKKTTAIICALVCATGIGVGIQKISKKMLEDDSYIDITKEYDYDADMQISRIGKCMLYTFYIVLLMCAEFRYSRDNYYPFIISLINYIDLDLVSLKDNKCILSELDLLMVAINKDEVLREKFNKLYEENKYLLNNSNELAKIMKELDISEYQVDSKKLVMRKGN